MSDNSADRCFCTQKVSWSDTVVLFAIFFPWVSFRLNDLDSQPWSFVLCSLYLVSKRRIFFGKVFSSIFLLLVLSFGIILSSPRIDEFSAIRSIIGIGSIFSVSLFIFNLKCSNKDLLPVILFVNVVWLLAGFLQIIFNPFIFDFVVNVRTSETRGVTSLAPEPTFYAVLLLTISWMLMVESRASQKNPLVRYILPLNLISILFVAKSSMGALYIFVILFLFFLYKSLNGVKDAFRGLFFISFGLLGLVYSVRFLVGTRLYDIFVKLVDSPSLLIDLDASINQRLSHIYYSVGGFVDNYGWPHGVNSFSSYAASSGGSLKSLFWSTPGDKIMSWSGSMLFELGFVGLLLLLSMASFFWDSTKKRYSIFVICVFLLISLSAIPYGFSPLSALVGIYGGNKFIRGRFAKGGEAQSLRPGTHQSESFVG
jgi:hypothetical protein